MSNERGPGPIPNRWLRCPRKSDQIIAERFLAFKTPLSLAYKDQMPLECMFLPDMIFGYCKAIKVKLGLWIDLTNTKRFYDKSLIEQSGSQYVKLQCRGHGETPSPEQTCSFIEIVDNFINDRPFDIIGVHCTHGFNRTGFLIVSYLVERLDCSVEAALAMFKEARPPGIYKQDYINELFRRYETEDYSVQAPELPDWCYEYDDSNVTNDNKKRKYDEMASTSQQAMASELQNGYNKLENDEVEDNDDNDQIDKEENNTNKTNGEKPRKKRRRELVIKNAQFMAGVPGVAFVTDQSRLSELQLKVQEMCGWGSSGFPGSQPVSMDNNNLKLLEQFPYRVSWKADGMRYMMLINKRDEIYFIDRNNSCFQVENLSFVKSNNIHEHLENTLLDGEMVLDKLNGQTIPRYLIYDIIKISNFDIGKMDFFPNRLACIKEEIIEPRVQAIIKGVINRGIEPFSVRNKEFWEIEKSVNLLGEKFARRLLHEPDGLIFQPSKEPYTPGVCPHVLKWKPLNMNSVDFLLKIVTEGGLGIIPKKIGHLYVGGYEMPFGKLNSTKGVKDLNNKIIECAPNERGEWEFMRERTDKTLPNSYKTAKAVVESIKQPVTKHILLEFIALHGYKDDRKKMPPPHPTTMQQRKPQPQRQ